MATCTYTDTVQVCGIEHVRSLIRKEAADDEYGSRHWSLQERVENCSTLFNRIKSGGAPRDVCLLAIARA
jgi:hypothetical protein